MKKINLSVIFLILVKSDLIILSVIKRNSLFFHSISCKNNGFLFTTPNIYQVYKKDSYIYFYSDIQKIYL